MKRKALGRGLSALLSDAPVEKATQQKTIQDISVELIEANEFQPRSQFDSEALTELAESIRSQGVLQPLMVRKHPEDPEIFQLIAGERRLRAAKIAELETVPCIILEADESHMLELALVENVQRSNLSSIDEARAYKHLIERFGLTQDEVSVRVGKSRESISNSMRLLNLPDLVVFYLENGQISTGHAKALLSLRQPESMEKMLNEIVDKGLSVRETERRIRDKATPPKADAQPKPKETSQERDVHIDDLEKKLEEHFQTKVNLKMRGNKKGSVEIHFYDYDQLEELLKKWRVELS